MSKNRSTNKPSSRRDFIKTTAVAGVAASGYFATSGVRAAESNSPNEKIQVACVGIGGKGKSDCQDASKFGEIVALCDIDSKYLDGLAGQMKVANKFADYREMFDKMGDKIDAVTVSTPDHTHAVISVAAMRAGKAVYCQKPLTRTIYEARRMGEIAKETGVATQMGNQYTAFNPMRKAAHQIKAGQLGKVNEVHLWTNRPVWPQGEDRPASKPAPSHVDWAQWIGPAPMRDYGEGYHPFKWRGWWDFGTGALGDMACHTANLPFMALNMRDPVSVDAETEVSNHDSFPVWSRIKFVFPELDGRAGFTMFWYDGGQKPDPTLFADLPKEVEGGAVPTSSGCMILGDKGRMYAAGDYAQEGIVILDTQEIEAEYPKSRGHNREWFDAIRDPSKPAMSNFATYAGPLTETILLGNLAVWKGGRVEWDAKTMTPLNDPSLMKIVKPDYQNGYELM